MHFRNMEYALLQAWTTPSRIFCCLVDIMTGSMLFKLQREWNHWGINGWRICHGPLARYVKLRVAHAPGITGTISPPPQVSDPDTHHGTCVTHVPWCMPGSLTSGFPWIRLQGKRSRHSRRMRNLQFYVSGKNHMAKRSLSYYFHVTNEDWLQNIWMFQFNRYLWCFNCANTKLIKYLYIQNIIASGANLLRPTGHILTWMIDILFSI